MSRLATTRDPDPRRAVAEIAAQLHRPAERAGVALFVSDAYDLDALAAALDAELGPDVVGCTSRGQIGPGGFEDAGITAVSFDRSTVRMRSHVIRPDDQDDEAASRIARSIERTRDHLPDRWRTFGLLLANRPGAGRESLSARLAAALGDVPFVGGTTVDGGRPSHVFVQGEFVEAGALFTEMHTTRPFALLRVQGVVAGARRLVVTESSPERRTVHELNGEPAAEAYAEALGVRRRELGALAALRPLVTFVDGEPFVRSVRAVLDDGSLRFGCAVPEGTILSLGESVDPVVTLFRSLTQTCDELSGEPKVIIGCDGLFRRAARVSSSISAAVGSYFARSGVVGFATSGEHYNGVAVNDTFTAIAIGG